MTDKLATGLMWGLPLIVWVALRTFLGDVWLDLYSTQGVSNTERYWLQRTAIASDFLAALFVLGVVLILYRKRLFARLPAVAPILLTAVALLVMVIREARRLWPYRDQYQLTELLAAADAVVVLSLMVGTILCAVAAFSPAGLGRRRLPFWRQGQVERAKSGNFGTADWMPISEARKRLPNEPGIVVGEAYRVDQDKAAKRPFNPKDRGSWGKGGTAPLLEYQCDTSSTHGLVFAGAGGFKSTSIAVPTLVRWPHSIITLDPSNELAPMTIAARKKMRRDVIVVSPNDPESSGFNVLSWIDPETPEADDNVASVVQWIAGDDQMRAGGGDNHFFISQGRALVTCLLSDLVFDPYLPESQRTLRTFRERLTESETAVKERLAEIHENSASYQARDLAGSLMDMKADETFSGIYANAADLTKWLSTRNYADLVSGSAFTTQQLVAGNLDLFINIPLKTLDSTPALARVLVGALLNAVYEARGDVPHRFVFLLDEVFRLKYMAALETARDAGRKYGITLVMLYQSLGQLERQFGKEGKRAWYDSAAWRAYASVKDPDTAKEIAEICGTYGVVQTSESRSAGTQRQPGHFLARDSRNQGENVSETKRNLVTVDEVLHDMRADEQILVVPGGRPIRCGRAIYFRRDDMVDKVKESAFA